MLSKADKIIFSIIGLLVILIVVFWNDVKALSGVKPDTEKVKKEKKKSDQLTIIATK